MEEKQKAAVSFARLLAALESLGVSEADSQSIWSVLAAIYHLGVAGATRLNSAPGSRPVFTQPAAAQRAATLLGCASLDDLSSMAFHAAPVHQHASGLVNGSGSRSSFRTGSPIQPSSVDKSLDPYEALEGFAQGLYVEAFSALVALINK